MEKCDLWFLIGAIRSHPRRFGAPFRPPAPEAIEKMTVHSGAAWPKRGAGHPI